jgi:serine/threonine protein phosphatase 1
VISILGNHDTFLIEFLENPLNHTVLFNISQNGLRHTIQSFLGITNFNYSNIIELSDRLKKKFPDLLDWLKQLPLYHETDTHIFVHAGLNDKIEDWRKTDKQLFVWDREMIMRDTSKINKKIVFGHEGTHNLRRVLKAFKVLEEKESSNILYYQNKVAIDGTVAIKSNPVNVYTFVE